MTGTGTQTDPYIISEYSEFMSAIVMSGAYIKCADNTVWDMNEIDPTGEIYHNTNRTVNFKQIDGNGAIIKNFYSMFDGGIFEIKTSGAVIKNLKFHNLSLLNHTELFYSYCYTYTVQNCEFTGIVSNSSDVLSILGTNGSYCTLNSKQNLFVLDIFNEGHIITTGNGYTSINYTNCAFIIGGNYTTHDNSYYDRTTITNCYFEGILPMKVFRCGGNYNVINANIQQGCDLSRMTALTVVNTDKCDDIDSLQVSIKIIKATSKEMKDPVFLRNNGFPVPIPTN
jgi:hypothetical protein